jgi:hypothetical protein
MHLVWQANQRHGAATRQVIDGSVKRYIFRAPLNDWVDVDAEFEVAKSSK